MTSLKNELLGTWKLLSYIEVPVSGTDSLFPLGNAPVGILIYSPDGHMSVQIAKEKRVKFQSGDKLKAEDRELIEAANSYIAFFGNYKVDNMNAILSYYVKGSLFPNWEGQLQQRKIDFDGNVLYINSIEPVLSNGLVVNTYMTWQRLSRSVDEIFEDSILNDFQAVL